MYGYAGIRHAFLNFTASNSFVMYFGIRFLHCYGVLAAAAEEAVTKNKTAFRFHLKNPSTLVPFVRLYAYAYAYGMRNKTPF